MRAELIGHFEPCMTEIYLHIDARMAAYIRTHRSLLVDTRCTLRVESLPAQCSAAWRWSADSCHAGMAAARAVYAGALPERYNRRLHERQLRCAGGIGMLRTVCFHIIRNLETMHD